MKAYPKILYNNVNYYGLECIAQFKYDGSNFRAEWGRKRGFYKFGSRNVMVDRNTPIFGESIDIFLKKYADDLDKIFRSEYKGIDSFVVFGEFFGPNSFAGKHIFDDKKDVVIFDVNQFRKGFLSPDEFIENFGHLDIPKVIYKGTYDDEFIKDVKSNRFNLSEGVVCKGIMKTKKEGNILWMNKVKTNDWILKVKDLYGMKALIEEFDNDKEVAETYIN